MQREAQDIESSETAPQAAEGRPRIWLLLGEKRGDNAQILSLAKAVGWDYEVRTLFVKTRWIDGKPLVRPTLEPIDLERSDDLDPPWPDLVITAGRRLSCVALWIKRASAGQTRLVIVGKPRRLQDDFDLIVAARHYAVAPGPNVAMHDLPLMHPDRRSIDAAVALWRERLGPLPRPLTALMVGGPTGGLRFDLATARDLLDKTLASVAESGGSLYVTTSRRTPPEITAMLRRDRPESALFFEFDAQASARENPYHALLGSADRFVVTTDSASMMVEVARLARPLAIYPLESEVGRFERTLAAVGVLPALSPRSDPLPGGGLRARLMARFGWPVHSRDLSAIPRWLVEQDRACWLGDAWVEPPPFEGDELEPVAARIRALVGERGGDTP